MIPSADHLILNRLAFGAGADDRAFLLRQGLTRWVDDQLAAPPGDDPDILQRLQAISLRIRYDAGPDHPAVDEMRPLTLLDQEVSALWPLADGKVPRPGPERQRPRQEVAAATLVRAIHSRWPLREVLVDFWHNHFNVNAVGDHAVAAALPDYDRTIRLHALGNFRAFIEAVAASPSMLIFLNNHSSRAGIANENYGRELFELHTLGRDSYLNALYNRWKDVPGAAKGTPAGFIDQDVYEAARAFTGWTIENGAGLGGGQTLPSTGRFTYVEMWHDNYQKRVLATEFDPFQPPLADGRKVLDLVAFHPATARYVCTKLCRRLVSDVPPEPLVAAAVDTWTANRHQPDQIARVVATIAKSTAIQSGFGGKVKRPLDLVAGFARTAGLAPTVTAGLLGALDASGQKLFGWPLPTGHPDTSEYWLGSNGLRQRWSLVLGLAENWWETGSFDAMGVLPSSASAAEAVEAWHTRLVGAPADPGTVAAILGGLRLGADDPLSRRQDGARLVRRIVAYCAMVPGFNLR